MMSKRPRRRVSVLEADDILSRSSRQRGRIHDAKKSFAMSGTKWRMLDRLTLRIAIIGDRGGVVTAVHEVAGDLSKISIRTARRGNFQVSESLRRLNEAA